jgi:O-antigen/teichoic acid export membrane protein
MIPSLSYIGTSISTVISEFINFILYYIVISRVFSYKIRLNRLAIRSLGALALMGFFVYIFKDFNLFFVIGISVIIYSLMLFVLKAFSQYEINLMKSLVQGR